MMELSCAKPPRQTSDLRLLSLGMGGGSASVDAACSLLASTPKLNLALLTISGTSSKGCCGLGRTHYADMADTSVIARFLDAARTGRVDGTGKQHGSGLGCVGTGLHIDADNEDEIALAFESVAQQMGGEGITEVL